MEKARITVSVRPDDKFEISMNEAGREVLIRELQVLSKRWDHIHLDCTDGWPDPHATEVVLSSIPYNEGDKVLLNGKLIFRPDDWDEKNFPHVMK